MICPRVIGLGTFHGDDQAGWLVLDALRERGYPATRLARAQHPADVLDLDDRDGGLVICDACVGTAAGMVAGFTWPTDRIAYQRPTGSHDLSLGDALELGRRLGRGVLPVQIWAIAGATWTLGALPSAAVCTAARTVAAAIIEGAANDA